MLSVRNEISHVFFSLFILVLLDFSAPPPPPVSGTQDNKKGVVFLFFFGAIFFFRAGFLFFVCSFSLCPRCSATNRG